MSKEKLENEAILQSVPGCIYWKDVNGVYLGCNQAEAEMLGFKSSQEVMGKTDYDLVGKLNADTLIETDKRIMQTKVPEEIIERCTLADGRTFEVLTRKMPLYDNKRNVVGIIGVSVDIMDRKAKEEKESKLKTQLYINNILQHVPGCIYWKDVNGVYLGCNQMEAEILGFKSPQEAVGKTDYDLSWRHEAEVLRKIDQRIMQSKVSEEIVERGKISNGKEAIMLTRKSPLYDDKGNVIGIIGVSIDITDRKEKEELESKLKIQEELYRTAKELAHDIASPISSLRMVEYIAGGKLSEEEKRMMNLAIKSIEGMSDKLIRKYRGVKNEENGQETKKEEYIELDERLQEIVKSYRYKNSNKDIAFKYEEDRENKKVYIKGNNSDFNRMMTNLIKNAEEAIEGKKGEVEISYEVKEGLVEIRIKDNGKGMPKETADKIINNEDIPTTKENGHGIGMKQIRGTLKAMKGKMDIKTQEGVGTEFILSFQKSEKPR